jgi:uncharacterized membrane protein YkvI
MKKFGLIGLMVLASISLQSCGLLEGIFEMGVWAGIIIAIIVVVIIIAIASAARRK